MAASSLTKYESQENSPKKGSGGRKAKKIRGKVWVEPVISTWSNMWSTSHDQREMIHITKLKLFKWLSIYMLHKYQGMRKN